MQRRKNILLKKRAIAAHYDFPRITLAWFAYMCIATFFFAGIYELLSHITGIDRNIRFFLMSGSANFGILTYLLFPYFMLFLREKHFVGFKKTGLAFISKSSKTVSNWMILKATAVRIIVSAPISYAIFLQLDLLKYKQSVLLDLISIKAFFVNVLILYGTSLFFFIIELIFGINLPNRIAGIQLIDKTTTEVEL